MTRPVQDYYREQLEVKRKRPVAPVLTHAPECSVLSLGLLASLDPAVGQVIGADEIAFTNATYRVVGWDAASKALLLERLWVDPMLQASMDQQSGGTDG